MSPEARAESWGTTIAVVKTDLAIGPSAAETINIPNILIVPTSPLFSYNGRGMVSRHANISTIRSLSGSVWWFARACRLRPL